MFCLGRSGRGLGDDGSGGMGSGCIDCSGGMMFGCWTGDTGSGCMMFGCWTGDTGSGGMMFGCRPVVVGVGSDVGTFVGEMSICHRRAPVCSRWPVRIWLPFLSRTTRWCLLKCAVQSASHSFPRLIRLCLKFGRMYPVRVAVVGSDGMAS